MAQNEPVRASTGMSRGDRAEDQANPSYRSAKSTLRWLLIGFGGFAANIGGLVQH